MLVTSMLTLSIVLFTCKFNTNVTSTFINCEVSPIVSQSPDVALKTPQMSADNKTWPFKSLFEYVKPQSSINSVSEYDKTLGSGSDIKTESCEQVHIE